MKVFVSYAREDAEFVDRLSGALIRRGFEVLFDRKDIPPLDVWKRELERMIRRADAAIFILSPDWRTSKMCSWELERVEGLGKRKAPIIARELDGEVPAILSDLQYVNFSGTSDFEAQAEALSTALNSDADWSRDHTSYQDKAVRWDDLKRPDGYCLTAQESKAAQKWLRNRPPLGAAPTRLQREFIGRSTLINSWTYRTIRTMQSVINSRDRTAAEVGRSAEKFFKDLSLLLLWCIPWAIICIVWPLGFLLRLPYRRWITTFAAFIKRFGAAIGTSLGLVQDQKSEWAEFTAKYKPGTTWKADVTKIDDQGAHVTFEAGVEGLIAKADLSASAGPIAPNSKAIGVRILSAKFGMTVPTPRQGRSWIASQRTDDWCVAEP